MDSVVVLRRLPVNIEALALKESAQTVLQQRLIVKQSGFCRLTAFVRAGVFCLIGGNGFRCGQLTGGGILCAGNSPIGIMLRCFPAVPLLREGLVRTGNDLSVCVLRIRLSVGIRVRCGRGIRIRSDILFCRRIAFRLLSTIGLSQLVLRRLAVLIGDRIHRHGGPGTAARQGQQQHRSQQ